MFVFIKSQHLFVMVQVMFLITVEFATCHHCSGQPYSVDKEIQQQQINISMLEIIVEFDYSMGALI